MGGEPASLSSRIASAAADLGLAAFTGVFVFLLLDPLSPVRAFPFLLAGGSFVTVRVLLAWLGDAWSRGTPGRLLCSLGVRDMVGSNLRVPAAVGRRLTADGWAFAPFFLGLWTARWRSGSAVSDFGAGDWVVVLAVGLDVAFVVLLAVRWDAGHWLWPQDWAFSTEVQEFEPQLPPRQHFPVLDDRLDVDDRIPPFDDAFRSRWLEKVAADPRGPFLDPVPPALSGEPSGQ